MLFYSNIFSLMDWAKNGIDPCSGMYLRHIPVASVSGNKLQGPEISLALRFNQFNALNYGFGVGWEFNLSHIDAEVDENNNAIQTLVLSNGARYQLIEDQDGTVTLKYKRTLTFDFKQTSANTDKYQLVGKEGIIETIENGRTTRVELPNGLGLNLAWNSDSSFVISDDGGVNLVTTTIATTATGKIHTVSVVDSLLDFTCDSSGVEQLTGVAIRSGPSLCSMKYAVHNGSYLEIIKWDAWVNYVQQDIISYKSLPKPSGLKQDVRAVDFIDSRQSAEHAVHFAYEYGKTNYLGGADGPAWISDADNLESRPDDYTYIVTEKIGNTASPAKVTEFHYNKFYLLVKCFPRPGREDGAARRKYSTYGYALVPGKGIDAQSSTFMLSVLNVNVSTGSDRAGTPCNVSRLTSRQYDQFANLVQFTDENGMKEWYEYYDVMGEKNGDGEVLCPADPNGFVNYIKTKIISSGNGSGDYPRKIFGYTYQSIAATSLVMVKTEQFALQNESTATFVAQSMVSHTYGSYGAPLKKISSIKSLTTDDYFSTILYFIYQRNENTRQLSVTKKIVGWDQVTKSEVVTRAYTTGLVQSVVNENGVITKYGYDEIGRTIRTVYAPGRPYGYTVDVTYQWQSGKQVTRSTTDAFSETLVRDGAGHVVKKEVNIIRDGKALDYLMAGFIYNEIGQLIQETQYDYAGEQVFSKTTLSDYNVYDELVSMKKPGCSSDDYQFFQMEDGTFSIEQVHQPGDVKTLTCFDAHGELSKREICSPASKEMADVTETLFYDAFLRLIRHAKTARETESFEYDAFDRPVARTGSSSGRQTMTYAPHLLDESVCMIAIDEKVIGIREFDGLGRQKSSIVDGVSTSYDYVGSAMFSRPSTVKISNGRTWAYQYDAVLDNVTRRDVSNADGTESASRIYEYDTRTRLLKSHRADQYTHTFSYDEFNNENGSSGGWAGLAFGSYSVQTPRSVQGLLLRALFSFPVTPPAHTIFIDCQYDSQGLTRKMSWSMHDALLCEATIMRDEINGNIRNIRGSSARIVSPGLERIPMEINYGYGNYNRTNHAEWKLGPPPRQNSAGTVAGKLRRIMAVSMNYDHHGLLLQAKYTSSLGGGGTRWVDSFAYNDRAQLASWHRTGNLVCQDQFGNSIASQSFLYDHAGNISQINSETSDGYNHAVYRYNANNQLFQIGNNSQTVTSYFPDAVAFTNDEEGHVSKQQFVLHGSYNIKTFDYGMEDGVKTVTAKWLKTTSTLANWYDAGGRLIYLRAAADGVEQDTARYYLDGVLLFEWQRPNASPQDGTLTIFHRVEGNMLYMTHVDKDGDKWVQPCLSQPDGTLLAVGTIDKYSRRISPSSETLNVYRYYDFHFQGQTAYGLTFDLKNRASYIFSDSVLTK